jgi:hypothetical protein
MSHQEENMKKGMKELEKSGVGRRVMQKRIAGAAQAIRSRRFAIVLCMAFVIFYGTSITLNAASITAPPNSFTTGTTISSSAVNQDFSTLWANDQAMNSQLFWSAATGGINFSGGNVGIGCMPSALLHLTATQAYLLFTNGTTNRFQIKADSSGTALQIVNSGDNLYVQDHSGNNRVTFQDGGGVGIGCTPTAPLTVARGSATDGAVKIFGTTYASHFNYDTAEDTYIRGGKSGSKVFLNDSHNGNVIIVGGGGNVGIGTTNPGYKLDISGDMRIDKMGGGWANLILSQGGTINGGLAAAGGGGADILLSGNRSVQIYTGGSAYFATFGPAGGLNIGFSSLNMYSIPTTGLLVAGNVGIGTASPGYRLQVGDTSNWGYVSASGQWTQGSDISSKQDIGSIDNSLDKVLALNGISYTAKADITKTRQIGFIAQDVEKVIPEIVSTDPISGLKGVAYPSLAPVFVEAMKELKYQKDSEIQALRDEIAVLKARLDVIEK